MCNACRPDPRDAVAEAERALWGLRTIITELPVSTTVGAEGIGAILCLIHQRMDGAVDQLQSYVPRDWQPPVA